MPWRKKRKTTTVDFGVWTWTRLGNLVPPTGSTHFRVVYFTNGTDSRHASTEWLPYPANQPLAVAQSLTKNPLVISGVIWDAA